MFGELLLAIAEVFARRGDHGCGHAEAFGDFDCEAATRRAVDQTIGRRERLGLNPKAALTTPSVVDAYDFSES
jgi:predicted oxidoreductase